MNTLVLYDSTYGNTATIARVLAGELRDCSSVQLIPIWQANGIGMEQVDLLFIGCPTQRQALTQGMRAWLEEMPHGALDGMPTAVFDTRGGAQFLTTTAAQVMAQEVKRRGAVLLLPPESFIVTKRRGPLATGEVERAQSWAYLVLRRSRQLDSHMSM
jgi:menaquinone-dependent protoporphyrinogen IX oxidase